MKPWLLYALTTLVLWGVWGALAGLPSENGLPETLNYVVWSLTMIPPAILVLSRSGQPLLRDSRSVTLGLSIGLLGAGGQLLLFHAVRIGPPYLIFPIISLSPALTIALSFAFLTFRNVVTWNAPTRTRRPQPSLHQGLPARGRQTRAAGQYQG